MVKYKTQKIVSTIGTIIYHIGISSIFPISNLSIFLISYLHFYQRALTLEHSLFFLPLFSFSMFISNFIHSILDKLVLLHFIMIIGSIFSIGGLLLMYFFKEYYIFLIAMSVMGLGFGLGNISSTKNMLKYYNESSFANTILSTVDIIGKALYTFLGFIIANDEFKNADDRHYFPLAISQRFFNFILFQIVLIGSTSLISVLMIFKEKKEVVLKSNYNVLIENEIESESEDEMIKQSVTTVRELAFITGSSFPIVQKDSRPLILSKKISKFERVLVLKSFRFWRLVLIQFFATFFEQCINNTFIIYGLYKEIPINILLYCAFGLCFFSLWGNFLALIISDKFSFKQIMITKSIATLGYGVVLFFNTVNVAPNLYVTLCSLCGLLISIGSSPLFHHIVKVYSKKYAIVIYAYVSMADNISNLVGCLSAFFVVTMREFDRSDLYLYIYYIGVLGNVVLLILVLFENEKEFIYNKKYNKL